MDKSAEVRNEPRLQEYLVTSLAIFSYGMRGFFFLTRYASRYVLWCYGYYEKEPSSNSSQICCIKLCVNPLAKRYESISSSYAIYNRIDWVL